MISKSQRPISEGAEFKGVIEMNQSRLLRRLLMLSMLLPSQWAHAHAPILDCFIKEGKVVCEAGFSDGSSAAGRKIQVLDARDRVLIEGVLDQAGTYSFPAPSVDYHVIFYGGDNHQLKLYRSNISE